MLTRGCNFSILNQNSLLAADLLAEKTQFTAVAAAYGAADSIVIVPGGHAVRPKILDI
ncbi:hypothetical protein B0H14DRAFT_3431138 [Mycena olivaceomarginata]|nr:hypothetical protein B0H14DRAFT_3431138 [Mycena olivaceomarginata]